MRIPMRQLITTAGVAALALGLTACGGASPDPPPLPGVDLTGADPANEGNGLWLLTGPDAVAEVTDAVRRAGSVRYSGRFTELVTPADPERSAYAGRDLTIDFRGSTQEFSASIHAGDLAADLVAVDGLTYVRGNAAYAAHVGAAEVSRGYVCTTSGDALLAEWAALLEPAALVETLLSSTESVSVTEPRDEATTLEVVVGSDAPVGRLTVAAAGAPLPIEFEAGDSSGDGAFTFTAWGEDPGIEAPKDLARDCD